MNLGARQQTKIKRYQNVFLLIVFSPHTHTHKKEEEEEEEERKEVFLPKIKVKETKSIFSCGIVVIIAPHALWCLKSWSKTEGWGIKKGKEKKGVNRGVWYKNYLVTCYFSYYLLLDVSKICKNIF